MTNDKSSILGEITGIRDENKLLEIFENNDDFETRYTIVNLIDDDAILYEIFSNEKNPYIKSIAVNRISTDILDYDDFNSLDAYEKITYIENHCDESLLFKVAENDEDFHVRIAAIYKISDTDFLTKMANNHPDYNTRITLYKKLNNMSLMEEITGENLTESHINLIKNLDNEKFLKDILFNDLSFEVRLSALKKLNKPDFYFTILKNSLNDDFRQFYEKISCIETQQDESLLFEIAENDENFHVRTAAIHNISDMDFLTKMANNHPDYNTRITLYKKLNNISLLEEITGENLTESHINLIKNLDNEKFLKDITINDSAMEVKLSALKKLNKPDFYFTILKNTTSNDDLKQLIDNIKDESQLMDVALFDPSNKILIEHVINNIANPSALFELYRRGSSLIRKTAMKKLVFGNIFSNERIADKISVERIILSVCNYDILIDTAKNDSYWLSRLEAVKKIDDKNVLADIARNDQNESVRKTAVEKIEDEKVLVDIAKNDTSNSVRRTAVEKINDETVLVNIAKNDANSHVRKTAVEKIEDEKVLVDIAKNDSYSSPRLEAVKKIEDKNVLIHIAKNDSDRNVRLEAVKKIDDKNVLADIARNDPNESVRKTAVEKIGDEKVLAEIARNDFNNDSASETSANIEDDDALADIAMNDSDKNVRFEAVRKINDDNVLADIARNCSYIDVRYEAILNISDENILVDVVLNESYWDFRRIAAKKINDKKVLAYMARNDPDRDVRRTAAEKIDNTDILTDILRNDADWYVREKALKNIDDANTLRSLLLENFGYFSVGSFSAFERDYDKMIYDSIGGSIYDGILDKLSQSDLIDLVHEKLFSDFRVMTVQRLVSPDVLRNLALNDLDYRVRRQAVKNSNLCDEKTFAEIVQSDSNDSVRFEALRRIDEKEIIEGIANDLNPVMRLYAFERLEWDFDLNECAVKYDDIDLSSISTIEDENTLYAMTNNAPSSSIRKYAFDKIKDENILAKLVCYNREFMNRAMNKITDNALLLNIALYCTDKSVQRKAVKKIDDEEFLLKAVQNNPYNDISAYIVDRIRNESRLAIIAFNNSNPFNRKAAVNKIQNPDILISLGEVECEEPVCTAIVRKCHDKDLLEYIGLSNPCKTVRRYVGSITDDDEVLYKMALKEYEYDNRREMISRLTNEEYILNLLKREGVNKVFRADFKITNTDMLIDLAKNSFSDEAKKYALNHIKDESVITDFIYSSPFSSNNPKNKSLWEDYQYNYNDKQLCLSILSSNDFNNMKVIEDFLIENEINLCGELYMLRDKVTKISSVYRIVLNCKSEDVRKLFMQKLEYAVKYNSNRNEMDEDRNEEDALQGLAALFG